MALPPLEKIKFLGDGSTLPSIGGGDVLIIVQNGKVLAVGRWLPTGSGGEVTPPLNEPEMVEIALSRLKSEAPELLKSPQALQLICWPELAGQMSFSEP
jgi:hypothetical protein